MNELWQRFWLWQFRNLCPDPWIWVKTQRTEAMMDAGIRMDLLDKAEADGKSGYTMFCPTCGLTGAVRGGEYNGGLPFRCLKCARIFWVRCPA